MPKVSQTVNISWLGWPQIALFHV